MSPGEGRHDASETAEAQVSGMQAPPSGSPLIPGILVGGKYRLRRKVGEGAMGVVWAATNETTVRDVALKLIVRPEPEMRQRLLREAKACGALKHPNIVDVIDVAQTDSGEPFEQHGACAAFLMRSVHNRSGANP